VLAIGYQLSRSFTFAAFMAATAPLNTKPYLVSLTRLGRENESCDEFRHLIRNESQKQFYPGQTRPR
jgi:hypothetical protein